MLNMVVKKMWKKKAKTGARRHSTSRRTNVGKTKNHPKRKFDREPCISDMELSHASNALSIKYVS